MLLHILSMPGDAQNLPSVRTFAERGVDMASDDPRYGVRTNKNKQHREKCISPEGTHGSHNKTSDPYQHTHSIIIRSLERGSK